MKPIIPIIHKNGSRGYRLMCQGLLDDSEPFGNSEQLNDSQIILGFNI